MARTRLAAAIASRWRVPEETIVQRLEQGRTRVKSGLPEAQARKVADELAGMGAIVSVIDSATGAPLSLAVPAAAPAFEFEEVDDEEGEDTRVAATLGTMYDPNNPLPEAVLTTGPVAPAPIANAPPATLAPPNLTPPLVSAAMGTPPVRVSGKVAAQPERRPPPGANMIQAFFFERPQTRIVAGAGIAMLLGLVLSTVYVSQALESGYQPIVDELAEYQTQEFSLSQWETDLQEVRKETVQSLQSRRTTVMVTSVLIWLLVGGGFSFAWFRYIC